MRLGEIRKSIQRQVGIGITALLLIVGFSSSAPAVLIDFDGANGQTGAVDVGSVDWNVSSFLAQNGVQAIANFQSGCVSSCQFTVLTHGSLSGVNNVNGSPVAVGGLNAVGGYEITFIAKFNEVVTAVDANSATFATVTGTPIVLEIYYDKARNSNPLNGSGFNDGRLILSGTQISDSIGSFQISNFAPTALDQFLANDYGNQNTVTGSGGQDPINIGNLDTDPTFFLQALEAFGLNFSNISTSLPFRETNPSVCFNISGTGTAVGSNTAGTVQCINADQDFGFNYAGQTITTNGGYVPRIGPTNGLFTVGFPDFIAQTDANASFIAAVPEPTSFLLFGLGLLGVGGYLRTRNCKTK